MANKRKTRMYEPWGYQDENNYKSTEIMVENDFDAFLVDTSYNKDDNKIYFTNKDGEVKASLDVNEFVKSDTIIEKTEYKDGILKIYFTNGDVVTIDLTELLDENEFKDGLIVEDHVVKVLIDGESDKYVSVSENGIKVAGIEDDIEAEEIRAISAETALDEKIDAEIARATAEEQRIDAKLDQEIADRIADVNEEEIRASSEEQRIETKLDEEITRAKRIEQALNSELDSEEVAREAGDAALGVRIDNEINDRKADVNEEEARAKAAEETLQGAIDDEVARATNAETDLQAAIEAEGQRAQDAETALNNAKFDEVVYDTTAKKITFYANTNVVGEIDTTDFVKDGMIDDVKIENDKLVIVFNTDAGKETIEIPLSEIFNPDNYYTKENVDELLAEKADTATTYTKVEVDNLLLKKTDREVVNGSNKALMFNESDGGGAKFENADGTHSYVGVNEGGANGIAAQIYAKNISTNIGTRIDINPNGMYYTIGNASSSDRMVPENEIAVKGDFSGYYTQEEVDALLAEKENEILSLKKIVADIGGNVQWLCPADGTFKNLMANGGTVKLTEDVVSSFYNATATATSKTKLSMNGKNVTITGLTLSSTGGGIRTQYAKEVTVEGKGIFDTGAGMAIVCSGLNSIITLGSDITFGGTITVKNNRSGGPLVYCTAGIVYIKSGIYRNDGADNSFLLNCEDNAYSAGTAKIIVTGGKFYDFDPGNNEAEGPGTSFLAEGYHTEASTVVEEGVEHTVYTVKKDA